MLSNVRTITKIKTKFKKFPKQLWPAIGLRKNIKLLTSEQIKKTYLQLLRSLQHICIK